mgnify:CR=1 FL=1
MSCWTMPGWRFNICLGNLLSLIRSFMTWTPSFVSTLQSGQFSVTLMKIGISFQRNLIKFSFYCNETIVFLDVMASTLIVPERIEFLQVICATLGRNQSGESLVNLIPPSYAGIEAYVIISRLNSNFCTQTNVIKIDIIWKVDFAQTVLENYYGNS